MDAKYIRDSIERFPTSPYTCILIDGPWGIGKTYEINEALKQNNNVYYISLFGIKDNKQIYHNIYSELVLNNVTKKKFSNGLRKIIKVITKFFDKEDIINEVITEEDIVHKILKRDAKKIIIFDDLERVSSEYKISEFLGIVSRLKQNKDIKIICVANQKEFDEDTKEVFELYKEKIIDKIYTIDKISANVKWEEIGIDKAFVLEFLKQHEVKNIRTLQKAQDLYEDIKLQISERYSKGFYKEIRRMCYGIVVEDIDKLYIDEVNKAHKENGEIDITKFLYEDFITRVSMKYLWGVKSRVEVVELLYNYYMKNEPIKAEILDKYYQMYIDVGQKADYFKSDQELKDVISVAIKRLQETEDKEAIISNADTIALWSEVLELDLSNLENLLVSKIKKAFEVCIENDDIDEIMYGGARHLESKMVQKIYPKCLYEAREKLVKNKVLKIKELYKTGKARNDYKEVYKEVWKFRDIVNIVNEKVLSQYLRELLIEEVFPIGSIDQSQYDAAFQVIKLMKQYINDELEEFCQILVEKYKNDKMFNHRLEEVLKAIKESR